MSAKEALRRFDDAMNGRHVPGKEEVKEGKKKKGLKDVADDIKDMFMKD